MTGDQIAKIRARGAGKTWELIQWAREDQNRIIATFSEQERHRLIRDYGLRPEQVIVPRFRDAGHELHGRSIAEVGIDNADYLLQGLVFPHDLKVATFSHGTIERYAEDPEPGTGWVRVLAWICCQWPVSVLANRLLAKRPPVS